MADENNLFDDVFMGDDDIIADEHIPELDGAYVNTDDIMADLAPKAPSMIVDESVEEQFDFNFDIQIDDSIMQQFNQRTLADETSSLDDSIERMLKMEQKQAMTFEDITDNVEFIKDVAVYDSEKDAPSEYDDERDIADKMTGDDALGMIMQKMHLSPLVMYIVAGALVLLIVGTVLFAVMFTMRIKEQTVIAGQEDVFTSPDTSYNNASSLYARYVFNMPDEQLMLNEMLFGPAASVFSFNRDIDPDKYAVSLTNPLGTEYDLDVSDKRPNALVFKPLTGAKGSFTLGITELASGETASYSFTLADSPTMYKARYVTTPELLLSTNPSDTEGTQRKLSDGEAGIFMDSAVFSNTGTDIVLKMTTGPKGRFTLDEWNDSFAVMLKNDADQIIHIKENNFISLFEDEGTVLARVFFKPLYNLDGTLSLTLRNLAVYHAVGETIPAQRLLDYKSQGEYVINTPDYNFYFEGMKMSSKKAVIVMHATLPDGTDQRVESRPDVELMATDANGSEIVIKGKCQSSSLGSDIVFDYSDRAEEMRVAGGLNVRINGVMVKMGDKTVEYDLVKAPMSTSTKYVNARSFLERSFRTRLGYKYDGKTEGFIMGFSDDLLNDRRVMSRYSPVDDGEEHSYLVEAFVVSVEENRCLANVVEYADGEETYHQVVADKIDGTWVIVSDRF